MASYKTKEPRRSRGEIADIKEGEDIISSFPEFLLIYILSFLNDTKQVVKTCVLSKRWQFVWTHLLEIDLFENSTDVIKQARFVNFVGRMISMCKSLNKFTVYLPYKKCFASNVNHWVDFAIKNNVKDITLQFYGYRKRYDLPQMLFSYSSLSNLYVSRCAMAPPLGGIIEWKSLESLTIEDVGLLDYVMENILSGCPLLKTLKLYACFGLKYLNIVSPNLTTLVYIGRDYGDAYIPDISASFLRILYICSDNCQGREFKLTNVSSVVQATIRLYYLDFTNISSMNHMKHLLGSLQLVETLVLGSHCLQVVSVLEVNNWKPRSYTKLWSLTLNIFNHEMSILGILAILRSSPNLKTLLIEGHSSYLTEDMEMAEYMDQNEICVKDCNMDLIASHLKTVEIRYLKDEHMLILVQILLKSTKVLEKMVINSSSDLSMEITNKVRTFPRASPNVVVVFNKC